jgi:hypothetical protein
MFIALLSTQMPQTLLMTISYSYLIRQHILNDHHETNSYMQSRPSKIGTWKWYRIC